LTVLVELEPVQFLTGFRAGTISLIDEFWISRVIATWSLPVM
jgi:hypothetical protein